MNNAIYRIHYRPDTIDWFTDLSYTYALGPDLAVGGFHL